MRKPTLLFAAAGLLAASPFAAAAPVKVVTTLSVYSAIAAEIGGDRVEATSISRGDEDAHFVAPKPSFALELRQADLFVTTGLDLELWAPVLIDKSGNRKIRSGGRGYVSASEGVPILDVPASADRSAGDVHVYGNPHLFTSPLNAKIVAANIAAGLERVDPGGAKLYRENLTEFERRLNIALYGIELLQLLGSETLDPLARDGTLIDFLESHQYQGRPLVEKLGGWLGRGLAFRGKKIVTYHKNWIYFTELFGLVVADYVEPKPGIPPSAQHVHQLIDEIRGQGIGVILAASYFGSSKVDAIAERTGARAILVPLGPVANGPKDYFALVDLWVGELAAALGPATGTGAGR